MCPLVFHGLRRGLLGWSQPSGILPGCHQTESYSPHLQEQGSSIICHDERHSAEMIRDNVLQIWDIFNLKIKSKSIQTPIAAHCQLIWLVCKAQFMVLSLSIKSSASREHVVLKFTAMPLGVCGLLSCVFVQFQTISPVFSKISRQDLFAIWQSLQCEHRRSYWW